MIYIPDSFWFLSQVVEESDQAMSRSNGFSKYPGSEIAVFWQRLNDWVEHLARQYVLFGREVSVQTQKELFQLDQLSET